MASGRVNVGGGYGVGDLVSASNLGLQKFEVFLKTVTDSTMYYNPIVSFQPDSGYINIVAEINSKLKYYRYNLQGDRIKSDTINETSNVRYFNAYVLHNGNTLFVNTHTGDISVYSSTTLIWKNTSIFDTNSIKTVSVTDTHIYIYSEPSSSTYVTKLDYSGNVIYRKKMYNVLNTQTTECVFEGDFAYIFHSPSKKLYKCDCSGSTLTKLSEITISSTSSLQEAEIVVNNYIYLIVTLSGGTRYEVYKVSKNLDDELLSILDITYYQYEFNGVYTDRDNENPKIIFIKRATEIKEFDGNDGTLNIISDVETLESSKVYSNDYIIFNKYDSVAFKLGLYRKQIEILN